MPSEALLGPAALLVGALIAVGVLWRLHLKADDEDRKQRDEFQALLKLSLENNRDSVSAWNRRNEQEATRRRREDRP